MLKFIAAAIWICVITVSAVFYSFQAAGERGADQPPKPLLGGLDYVKTDIIFQGYFLTNLVYTVDPAQVKKLSVPAPALITDQIYSYLYQNPQIDFTRTTELDVDAFRKNIRDTVNARVGEQLIHEVLIDQINFLSKDEIRNNTIRRRRGDTTGSVAKPKAE